MKNFLRLWFTASLSIGSNILGEAASVSTAHDQTLFDRGVNSLPDKYAAGYNAPAHFDTCTGSSFCGSFILWAVKQDYMDVAISSTQPSNSQITGVAFQPSFNLQPGFKLSVSTEFLKWIPDGWVIEGVYTRCKRLI